MINKHLLNRNLENKFDFLTLHAIVNECFIEALPFKNQLTHKEIIDLSYYSKKVMESLGGNIVVDAIFANEDNDTKLAYLAKMYSVCKESSTEASDRIVKECDNTEEKMEEIVDKAAFNEGEYKKFLDKSKEELDIAKVTRIINDKVVKVLKDEKKAYEEHEELEEELQEKIVAEGKTLEGYYSNIFSGTEVTKPISLFSKLQSIAIENLSFVKTEEDLPTDLIGRITTEQTFDFFNYSNDPIRDIKAICESAVVNDTPNSEDIIEKSFTIAVTIYTLLETLNSLNLLTLDKDQVAKLLEKSESFTNIQSDRVENLKNVVNNIVSDLLKSVTPNNVEDAKKALEELTEVENMVSQSSSSENNIGNLLDCIKDSVTCIQTKIEEIEKRMVVEKPQLSLYDERDKENDILELNKIARSLQYKTLVKDVRICVNSNDKEVERLNIELRNPGGTEITPVAIPFNHKEKFGAALEYIKESVSNSNLMKYDTTIHIYNTADGKITNIK